ncbi:MAG: hypothetical protein H0T47_00195 [Planctomycetaceae bacterium]|nr:hypothetical protein [Planctomycetaceae bacterium]
MSPQTSTVSPEPVRSRSGWITILIAGAAGLHAAALLNSTPLQSANDRSRWSTVWALVERGTFEIDEIDAMPHWQTIDKVQQNGHLYSTKPALLTVMASEIYRAVRQMLGWSIYGDTAAVTRVVLAVVNLLPWLVALFVFALMARKYAKTPFARGFIVAAAAFGSYLSTYSVTFNNHTVAAVSLIFAMHFALRIVADGSRRWWDFALCGLTSAFVTTNELPAAAFGLAMFGLLCRYDWRRTLLFFVSAALIPIAAFLATTWMQTGNWKPFYLSYGTEKYVYIRDGVPSYWADPKGLDRNLDSPLVYFLHCTIGHHGILSLSPIFLITIASWLRMWTRPAEPYRPLLWMGLAITVLILGFYLSRTENYNYGGNSVALRWAIWLVPFWLLALLPTLDDFADRRWFRGLAAMLLAVSTFSAWEAIANPWRPSWLYSVMESVGWIDYRDHDPPLPRTLTTWFTSLPPAGADPQHEWIELSATTDHGIETLRLELVEPEAARPRVRLTRSHPMTAGAPIVQVTATIDRETFESGADAQAFVVAGEPSVSAAVRVLRMLPAASRYRPGHVRYERTALRELAFRTQHVTTAVDARRANGDVIRRRIDAWLCPDVPFGVVRLRETITDARSGDWLTRRDYVLSAAGRIEAPEWAKSIPGDHAGAALETGDTVESVGTR